MTGSASAPLGPFRVRVAMAGDAACLQAIFAANIRRASWLPPESRRCTDFAAASVGETILVAIDGNGDVCGFVSVQAEDSFIHHLHVRAEARGRGIGSLLLNALHGRLPAPWRLKCVKANTSARAFYRRRGWKRVATGESGDGTYFLMEWQPANRA